MYTVKYELLDKKQRCGNLAGYISYT